MVPRTFPSSLHPFTGRRQLVALFLGDVTGLQRWVDYIPVNFGSGTSLVEGSYENNGFIAIQEISSGIGLQAFLDYIPVFFDAGSTDTWRVSAVGFIPYGVSGVTSPPSLELSFTRSQTLDPRITFTRSTTATFTGSDGLIQTAAINAPRFDYNPTTLAPLGLLIEEQRTNLQINSEDFTNADWTKGSNTTITANTIVSPAGTLTADTFGYTSITSGVLQVADNQTKAASSITYTSSVYVKASSNLFLHFYVDANSTSNSGRVIVNTSTWTVLSSTNFGTFTSTSGTVNAVGNGWYRITCTTTSGTETNIRFNLYWSTVSNTITFTPVGTENVYIWGAQLEAGAFATSYIPTVASQVTRSADVAVMTGTNFSSWYNASEGTLYSEFAVLGDTPAAVNGAFSLDDGTNSNRLHLRRLVANNNASFFVSRLGATQASITTASNSFPVKEFKKAAAAYKLDDFAIVLGGVLGGTDSSGTPPVVTQAVIGNSGGGTASVNGHIRQIVYYPRRLANAELQGITA